MFWLAAVTRIGSGAAVVTQTVSRSVTTRVLARATSALAFLRSIPVAFTLRGFGPSEALLQIAFDGVTVTPANPSVVADANGVLSGSFTIPSDIPAGAKQVQFRGAGGSRGEATFVGQGMVATEILQRITTTVMRQVTTIVQPRTDPLAQTFTLAEDVILGRCEVWFKAIGDRTHAVRAQIRTVSAGVPSQTVLAEGHLNMTVVQTSQASRISFTPAPLIANTEYALVILTDDAAHALAIAELGQYDPVSGWVTRQPYQIGVLLSSSNASTWTAHQNADLAFRLLAGVPVCGHDEDHFPGHDHGRPGDRPDGAGRRGANFQRDGIAFRLRHVESGETFQFADNQALALTSALSGTMTVEAVLSGTATITPALLAGAHVVAGQLAASAAYVSRAITAATTFTITSPWKS